MRAQIFQNRVLPARRAHPAYLQAPEYWIRLMADHPRGRRNISPINYQQQRANSGAANGAFLLRAILPRARNRLGQNNACALPLSQVQLGQTLGMSHISVNRALQTLRGERLLDIRNGRLEVLSWRGLVRQAGFDPAYLHAAKDS
jgi:CRP-like cAMP-binding protein